MSLTFNPFTGTLDFVGGASVTTWKNPVADAASLPLAGNLDGDGRVTLDTDEVWIWDGDSSRWENQQIQVSAAIGSVPNAAAYTIEVDETTPNLRVNRLVLQPADSSNPGILTTGSQNIAGDKTFDNNVIVTGDLTVNGTETIINTATLDVEDQNITVNKNGTDITAEGAGITVERAGTNGSLIYEDALEGKFKAGPLGLERELVNVNSPQTIINKDLSNPTNNIDTASSDSFTRATGNQNLVNIPDASSVQDIILNSHPQTLENKFLNNSNSINILDNNLFIADNFTPTKLAQFDSSQISPATTRTFAFPDANTELVGTDVAQTLTNKTIDGDDNTIQDVAITSLKTELADADKFIQRDAAGAVISGKDVPVGDVVGTSDAQTLTNKTIDADANTITNIENADIKVGAAIDAEKIADGSINNTEFQALNAVTGNIQSQLDDRVVGPATATDDALVRYDSTTGKLVQDSLVTVDDAGVLSGATQVNVDNIQIDGNTISSSSGDIQLSANADIDANSNVIKNVTDPTNPQDVATKAYVDNNTSAEPGDLDQVDFAIANNQSTFADVTGVAFANGVVRSAELQYSVEIDATADLFESGKLFAVQRGADWSLMHTANGDNSQVTFDINASGQLQYRSANYAGFVSGTIKVRAVTTSI